MAALLRYAYRGSRIVWRPQHPRQRDVSSYPNSLDNAFLPITSILPSRQMTSYSSSSTVKTTVPLPLTLDETILEKLDLERKLRIANQPKTDLATDIALDHLIQSFFLDLMLDTNAPFYLKSSPVTIGPSNGEDPTAIAPPLPLNRVTIIDEPAKGVPIVISDKSPGEKVIVGDQPSPNAVVEIIGDRMDNVVKKEAKRILQIKRTKMNRHKLLKWRRKYKHLIKTRLEKKEKAEKKELDDAVAAIHGDADTFNPVDKVRRHVELAKEMGYKVSFYQDLPLTKWLKEKEKADDSSKIRFENRNRERYRKKSPLEYEKY